MAPAMNERDVPLEERCWKAPAWEFGRHRFPGGTLNWPLDMDECMYCKTTRGQLKLG